jgi:hypothetical protein
MQPPWNWTWKYAVNNGLVTMYRNFILKITELEQVKQIGFPLDVDIIKLEIKETVLLNLFKKTVYLEHIGVMDKK